MSDATRMVMKKSLFVILSTIEALWIGVKSAVSSALSAVRSLWASHEDEAAFIAVVGILMLMGIEPWQALAGGLCYTALSALSVVAHNISRSGRSTGTKEGDR